MISLTKLYCESSSPGDALRYERAAPPRSGSRVEWALAKRPIVVWNMSRRCNLRCVHCYSDSHNRDYPGELTTAEAKTMIDNLAEFKVPVLLFSGGEPLLRADLFELAGYAQARGIRTTLSTNGTLITADKAAALRQADFTYVGISLDGTEANNDRFRNFPGAYQAALKGIRNCVAAGQRVGLRLTLTQRNFQDLDAIFDLIEHEQIDRACFYHLVYSGRGADLMAAEMSHEQTRAAVNLIIDRAKWLQQQGKTKDILTVDNHTDGVFLYRRLREENPTKAQAVYDLLRINGGNGSGVSIANVDNLGQVHADQFWPEYSFGNVRERKFSEIWTNLSDPLMRGLKDRRGLLHGRCGACRYLEICNGNFRVRAKAVYGDVWAPDPACYLTDEEIGL